MTNHESYIHYGNKAREAFLQGNFKEAKALLKVSTRHKGIAKRSTDAMLQATIVYPFDIETYALDTPPTTQLTTPPPIQ